MMESTFTIALFSWNRFFHVYANILDPISAYFWLVMVVLVYSKYKNKVLLLFLISHIIYLVVSICKFLKMLPFKYLISEQILFLIGQILDVFGIILFIFYLLFYKSKKSQANESIN